MEETFPWHERPWVNITSRLLVLWKLNWICKLNEKCPGNYLNTFNFISFLMTVLTHWNLCEKLSNYFWVIITTWQYDWNSWESPCDWNTYSANLLSAFGREWFNKLFPYNHPRLWLCTGSLSPLSTSEELFLSCFSGVIKHYWSTFTHHPISRMGISWICTLAC